MEVYLVGILHDEVLPIRQLHADVDNAAQDTPGVVHAQVDLVSELHGPELLCAQNHVLGGVPHIDTRHIPEEREGEADAVGRKGRD